MESTEPNFQDQVCIHTEGNTSCPKNLVTKEKKNPPQCLK